MGFAGFDSQEVNASTSTTNHGGQQGSSCSWRFLTRRKKVNSHVEDNNHNSDGVQLAKELTIPHLMAVGNSIMFFLWVLIGSHQFQFQLLCSLFIFQI